jgi:DNA-directed RNA polymerase subunit omega
MTCVGLERRLFHVTMARVTVEDCLEREENRFALVVLAAARTRQLMKGDPMLVRSRNKPAVTSLREIAAGKVHFHRSTAEVVNEWVRQQQAGNH